MALNEPNPPCYVLLAHSHAAGPSTLVHPVLQYHYADDPPLSILPTKLEEHVLVLNHDPSTGHSVVQSISDSLVVTNLRVEEAPGAAVEDPNKSRNNSMFIIETTSRDQQHVTLSHNDRQSAQLNLATFRQRNAVLRKVLDYPAIPDKPAESVAPGDFSTRQQLPSLDL